MPQTSPMSWTMIVMMSLLLYNLLKSVLNWNIKMNQMKETKKKTNIIKKWSF